MHVCVLTLFLFIYLFIYSNGILEYTNLKLFRKTSPLSGVPRSKKLENPYLRVPMSTKSKTIVAIPKKSVHDTAIPKVPE